MRKLFVLCCILLQYQLFAQKALFVGFYNQENLFDTIDDPHKNDNEFLPDAKIKWDTEKYSNKINHITTVIASMNGDKGADVLGMCEVENDAVLTDVINHKNMLKNKYAFVHYESPDERSIDNALLYKTSQFKLIESKVYPVKLDTNPNFKTRDILLVKLQAKNKANVVFLVNHFPSRLGGQKESAYKRFQAASVLKHIFDSIKQADPNQAVIAMGDFNDEPTDASIDSVLDAKGEVTADIYNAMADLKQQGKGSYYYRGEWELIDQIIMNSVTANCMSKFCYKPASAAIYEQPWMVEAEGKYKGAPLRTFAGQKYLNGYSDHFPVYIYLELK